MKFAEGYPKDTETGWILFPRDTEFRKGLFFPPEVSDHPAKINLHLQQSIIEYVAKPNEVLLDPFGGTGSLMIAALQNMRVILLEIEDGYYNLQQQAKANIERQVPGAGKLVTLIKGDNRFLLPISCNHIITSPPYASMMAVGKGGTKRMKDNPNDSFAKMDKQMGEYSKGQRNIGHLNNFLYNMAMEKVYKLCGQSIIPGGTLTIILKDRIEKGKRVDLTGWASRVCLNLGLQPILHEKWKTPGIQFTAINRAHGLAVVEDESIIIWRKP